VIICCKKSKVFSYRVLGNRYFVKRKKNYCSSGAFQVALASYYEEQVRPEKPAIDRKKLLSYI
jgi:hypothetical protein